MIDYTSYNNSDKELNSSNYITLYQSFKDLNAFFAYNNSYLLGRGFKALNKDYRLTHDMIGECFGTSAANVARMIAIYNSQPSHTITDSASPSQVPADRRATTCVPAGSAVGGALSEENEKESHD